MDIRMCSHIYLNVHAGAQAIIKVSGHQRWWLAGGYVGGNRTFLEVASMASNAIYVQCTSHILS